jgi:hypothetical protein
MLVCEEILSHNRLRFACILGLLWVLNLTNSIQFWYQTGQIAIPTLAGGLVFSCLIKQMVVFSKKKDEALTSCAQGVFCPEIGWYFFIFTTNLLLWYAKSPNTHIFVRYVSGRASADHTGSFNPGSPYSPAQCAKRSAAHCLSSPQYH